MRYFSLLTAFMLVSVTVSAEQAMTKALTVVGSDLLNQALSEPLKVYERDSSQTISTEFLGSLPALSALREGKADLGLLAIPQGGALPEDRYHLYPFAYQVAFVVVNAANPVGEISLPQLDRMYSAEPRERIERWGQMGLSGTVAARSVQIYLLQSPDSVVVELFKQRALNAQSIRNNVNTVDSLRRMSEQIAGDLGAIGIANRPPLGTGAKTIPVSTGEAGSFAFGPSPENVYYGDYPLVLPFYIAVPRGQLDAMRDLVRYLLSDEVAAELSKTGYMPLAENIRKRTLAELDMRL